jgi:hypothetical protein
MTRLSLSLSHSEKVSKARDTEEWRVQYCPVEIIAETIAVPARHIYE